MLQPILLSDEEEDLGDHQNVLSTPFHMPSKKQRRTGSNPDPDPNPSLVVLIDDPTPQKSASASTPSVVPETPMSALNSDVVIVKCTTSSSDHQIRVSDTLNKFSGICGLICLESDNESEGGSGRGKWKEIETGENDVAATSEWSSRDIESTRYLGNHNSEQMSGDSSLHSTSLLEDAHRILDYPDKENVSMEQINKIINQGRSKVDAGNKNVTDKDVGRKKMTKEERIHLMEDKKQKKEQEKLQKAAQKAEAAEVKRLQKERQKWEKGKFALKSIVAEIDAKVVELGSIGGHLLTRFAEKGLTYRITSNPVERSIVWSMSVPEHISQLSNGMEIPYVLIVYEADQFCDLVVNEALLDHVACVRSHYPTSTICYLTNRLMAYINKREQEQYKNPSNNIGWRRPPVEEALAKLTTHFNKVHSRQCVDEAELAEHVAGLTSSLASCQFSALPPRQLKKLTRLSVNANGSLVSKDTTDKNIIKKSLWLKSLISVPKVQPRFAIAISKKYPTMKSLLSVYMDPSKSVHEKEFLLKDLTTEGLLGEDRRLGEVCSKRVYRILMAQSGSVRTDDVEDGADFFRRQSS
ncbi:Crossover junction endonuclease EME1B [Morella rubra]|uniref:Crossover junction endonuclease EME1B n=1 Tax=Morella rubra TaxID=262757 RepID=A0A6A1VC34_9ROSI|nr:Crossover junction endonuclease EME1B [Morella rubra]